MADPDSYGNPERDIEQAFLTLKRGTQLVKYSRKGKPKLCNFRLSQQDETSLIWISHGKEKSLNLSSVLRIISGQRTAVFRRYLRPEKDYLSFSLIYKKGERSLDLICKDTAEVEVWLSGLKALISTGQVRRRHARSDLTDDSSEFFLSGRPSGGSLESTSIVSKNRFSFESVSGESTSSIRGRSDAGSDHASMPVRTSVGDGSRVSVSGVSYVSSVGSGQDDIESLGDVFIWGEVWADGNSSDGLGSQVPSKIDVLIPKPLESNVVLDVNLIEPGVNHIALVTRQGEIFTWGEDFGGRLGHGFDKDFGKPNLVESLAVTNMSFVACGEYHTCAVSTSGDLYTWGDGAHNAGILGHGTDVSHCIPKRVTGNLEGLQVVSIACGSWHTALITASGKLFTFGDGILGVLGHGDRESASYPKEVQLSSGHRAIQVACGVWHTAAIIEVTDQSGSNPSSAKRIFTWGDGDQYRLGHANKETYLQPTCVTALAEYNFHQVACGQSLTVALTASGHVFSMGSTAYGQLGNPNSDGKMPILVRDKLQGESAEEISCGTHHVAVLTSRSELYTWGRGANGRLGHGDIEDQKTPTLVEALKERHVKNISCGANFTTCICIHKWVSGNDQSVCSGCRQPFGFTRKRHNCYHCGLVYCHPCSSKKALKAALAPTPSKPHRVCDTCHAKLKGSDSGNSSNYSREMTRPSSSTYGREKYDKGEVRTSSILLSSATGLVKYFDIRSNGFGSANELSSMARDAQVPLRLQLKDVIFPGSSSPMQNASRPLIMQQSTPPTPPSMVNSRSTSPYSRRPPSPTRSISPGFSRSLIDNLKKKNENLNQEVSKLKNHIRSLKKKADMQDMKIHELQKNIQEANLLAGEESSKHRETREFITSMADELREVTEKLPPEIPGSEALKQIHTQARCILRENVEFDSPFQSSFESEQQSAPNLSESDSESSNLQRIEGNGEVSEVVPSIDAGSVPQESNRSYLSSTGAFPPSSENSSRSADSHRTVQEGETSVIEQFEHGVYITVIVLSDGSKIFKRVRFSKRRYNEQQAEEWWNKNKDRVYRRYSPPSEITGSSSTPSHGEGNIET
ncbi:PH, RCC1 and FYVE domains-containing protein 1 isoform X1 [Lathyrus oleraceus]|uniref:PH, RCC1 and FYVE domains-containing protein 1 isoform X1 n=1 Tax=Pisum sativum TaxID=3888 RepID=UPI0021D037C3|nr:PH, RCC1 and FYVE domains-containing protein 1-like isoform X1 [Pisum sativum]XP_050889023.1 PH, RCC1 and FYVE domains-containing protein 1-like isoform X1 [Pisum sativum]XP_050889025.1 PH, RCC1 and FYVE domains-containing protein 1-like isoform X1 [Pisum sativum]